MLSNLSNKLLSNIYLFLLSYFLGLFLLTGPTSLFLYISDLNDFSKTMDVQIKEYADKKADGTYDSDRQTLCSMIQCSAIININSNKHFIIDKNGILKLDKKKDINLKKTFHIYDNVYYVSKHIVIYNNLSNTMYFIQWDKFYKLLLFLLILNLLGVLILIMPIYIIFKRERFNSMLAQVGTETMLTAKNIMELTENLHHEINSPIEVIYNHVELIKREMYENMITSCGRENCKNTLCKRHPDNSLIREEKNAEIREYFKIIEIAEKQLFEKIAEMSSFKHLKYKKDEKRNIYQLASAAKSLASSKTLAFKCDIDEKLKKYYIDKLPETDLLGIFLNHIKNSIDVGANAQNIVIKFIKEENDKIHVYIIDDGNGIPEDFIPNLFTPNLSTKDSDGVLRGNGMFMNKYLMEKSGGNINLVKTSSKGTIIELVIPIKKG
jgi:signal transduction histidine kinase